MRRYEWRECKPKAAGTLLPGARAGHSAVFFAQQRAVYFFGGFESVVGEGTFFASNALWRLHSYSEASRWEQVREREGKGGLQGG